MIDVPGAGTAAGQGTGCFGCTFSINESGVIAGTLLDANNVFHGFVRSASGHVATFQAPGADTTTNSYNGTFAQGINDDGVVTGLYFDPQGLGHGFVLDAKGTFTVFDAPGAVYETWPISIDARGDIVGYLLDGNLLFKAFLRHRDGTMVTFVGPDSCTSGIPGACYGSAASWVGGSGRAVGNFMDNSASLVEHGMLRSAGGVLTTFDAPGAGTGQFQGTGCPGCNFGSNAAGAIAGQFVDANNVSHGFVRDPQGRFTTFDIPGAGTAPYQGTGCYSDCPMSLNDRGQVVGSYYDASFAQHGFLRNADGSALTLLAPGALATQPEAINAEGAIVGYFVDASGVYHGFLRNEE